MKKGVPIQISSLEANNEKKNIYFFFVGVAVLKISFKHKLIEILRVRLQRKCQIEEVKKSLPSLMYVINTFLFRFGFSYRISRGDNPKGQKIF